MSGPDDIGLKSIWEVFELLSACPVQPSLSHLRQMMHLSEQSRSANAQGRRGRLSRAFRGWKVYRRSGVKKTGNVQRGASPSVHSPERMTPHSCTNRVREQTQEEEYVTFFARLANRAQPQMLEES